MDLLTEDQQRLAALRVRIADRLGQCHEVIKKYQLWPMPNTPIGVADVAARGALNMLIQELEVLAEIAGIETGVPA